MMGAVAEPTAVPASAPRVSVRSVDAVAAHDRWKASASKSPTAIRAAVVVASVAAHGLFGALVLASARSAPVVPAPAEIAVEIVQEKPPAPKAPAAQPAPPRQAQAAPPNPPEQVKAEQPKPEQPKPEQPKPEQHAEPAPASKPEQANKTQQASKADPPAKAERPVEPERQTKAVEPPKPDTREIDALKGELAQLRAEQASLQGEARPAQVASANRGTIDSTFQPVAMSAASDDGSDSESYESLVFGRIEAAKGFDGYKGAPGAANVGFTIGDAGEIATIAITTSSGSRDLDAKAIALVRKAAPFAKPPAGAQRTFVSGVSFGRRVPKL